MNPGISSLMVVTFPIAFANLRVSCTVAKLVARPGMTSTNFITGTGFMKCMPITRSALLLDSALTVDAPIFVIEIEEVFVARMALG